MSTLSLDDLLALPDAEEQTFVVEIKEAGGMVLVRAISMAEYLQIVADCGRSGEWDELRWNALMLHHGLAQPKLALDDALRVCQKPAGMVTRLVREIMAASGLTTTGGLSAATVKEEEATFREE